MNDDDESDEPPPNKKKSRADVLRSAYIDIFHANSFASL